MTQLFFTQMPIDELKTVILEVVSDVVKKEFKNELQAFSQPALQTELLTRKETAGILGVSLPTLNEWTKEGRIPAYRIGSRVRYKRAEVEQSLIKIKGYKSGGYNA